MSELSDLLKHQKEQLQAKAQEFAAITEERRRAYVEALKQSEATAEELKRVEIVLKKLEEVTAKSTPPKIMQAVLEVLKLKPEGMTALEILAEINSRYFDGKIMRTSLSPQLSRLKDRDKKITLRGNRWYLLAEQPTLFTRKS
jgi:hypothetical protein